jgi:hypothetical protein
LFRTPVKIVKTVATKLQAPSKYSHEDNESREAGLNNGSRKK